MKNYKFFQITELDSILTEINKFYNRLHNDSDLISQINSILKKEFN